MRFQSNIKWCRALFLWRYEVSMMNSYISFKWYCELKGVPVKWTHHDWNQGIRYAHLDLDEDWPRKKQLQSVPPLKIELQEWILFLCMSGSIDDSST